MKKATYFYGIWCQNGIPFLAPYSAKTEPVLAPYSAKTELRFWHHMVPHGASWCQKVPKRGTQIFRSRKKVISKRNLGFSISILVNWSRRFFIVPFFFV